MRQDHPGDLAILHTYKFVFFICFVLGLRWFCSGVDCEAIKQGTTGSKILPVNEQTLLDFLNILHPNNLNYL
jgi:hypothetical protein